MNLQLAREKMRLVLRLKDTLWYEVWGRKQRAAQEATPHREPTPSEIEAAPVHDGNEMDVNPLFRFGPLQTVVDADRLYWQAEMDLRTHDGYPDSEIAKAKKVAAARMREDAKRRAAQALKVWARELELLDLP